MADHERRVLDLHALLRDRRGAPEQQALEHVGRPRRVAAQEVEQQVEEVVAARHAAGRDRGEAQQRAAELQHGHDRGEDHRHGEQCVLEHGHLHEQRPRALRGAGGELERDVGAERGAADHGLVDAEVVEQRRDLVGERAHRVIAGARCGPPDCPWPSRLTQMTRLPALGELRAEALEHRAVHQQAVDQDDDPVALAVLVVDDRVALEAELAHRRESIWPRASAPPAARSQGFDAVSAPRIARVAGALLSV